MTYLIRNVGPVRDLSTPTHPRSFKKGYILDKIEQHPVGVPPKGVE